MKKVINVDELTKRLNSFIQNESKKTFTGAELQEELTKMGFNKTVSGTIANKLFPFEKLGTSRLYSVPKNPVYIGWITGIYKDYRGKMKENRIKNSTKKSSFNKEKIDTDTAWQTLLDAGLVKRKFNLELLKSKYPKIYLECLDYEVIK